MHCIRCYYKMVSLYINICKIRIYYRITFNDVHLDTELCKGVSNETGVMQPCPCSLGLSSSVSLSSLPECHHAIHHALTLQRPDNHPPRLW